MILITGIALIWILVFIIMRANSIANHMDAHLQNNLVNVTKAERDMLLDRRFDTIPNYPLHRRKEDRGI